MDGLSIPPYNWGGRVFMVVGYATTYVISVYHHWCCEFDTRSGRGVQHYVIKFVSDLRQVGGFLGVLRFSRPIKLTATNIAEILLKVTLNTTKQTNHTTDATLTTMYLNHIVVVMIIALASMR